ncbi:hypothetical protein VMCG_05248 [Cytospora schulzeri]|uniref:Rhodopsin domain-containing protein n=1 Tax=Cytospora schulzeri TaxID=448051 RepID=A0A423WQN9_9PEZI|nr:hypothetical protein VMCG_05248 [Valsa malicola]
MQGSMKYLIWFGFFAASAACLPGIPIGAYFSAPSPGQSWYGFMLSDKAWHGVYWGLVQSVLGILLDLYIFILPLPILYQLKMSKKKRIQVTAVFSTAFLAVIATVLSLVYRVLLYKDTNDQTWYLYALLLCTVVELNISIIVSSMPGFAKIMRLHGSKWISLASRWSKSSGTREKSNSNFIGQDLWKLDSLGTGPVEPATYLPQKPQALLLAYLPASHTPKTETSGPHGYYGSADAAYFPATHSQQPGTNISEGHYELMGSAPLERPAPRPHNPDSSWLTD